jgi:hypothetical protein
MTASEAKLLKRGGFVASPLNKHIKHVTLAIDGTPQIHALAIDRYDHFIEVPLTIRSGPRMS